MEPTACYTVGQLIEALRKFPPDTVPISPEPLFTGVKLIPQGATKNHPASVLIAAPRRPEKDEDCFGRKREPSAA